MQSQASSAGRAWEEVLKQVLQPHQAGVKAMAMAGAELPVIGMELADEKGVVVADSEICWGSPKLVVLRKDQADMAEAWHSQGWKTLVLDESLTEIGGAEWSSVVAKHFGLNLPNKE